VDIILYILGLAFVGLIYGALGRLLLPGRDPMTLLQTIGIGIAGSLVAGLIAYYAFDKEAGPGFLFSLLCTVILVWVVRKVRQRRVAGPARY
jgi:uncharacterized membrane protein YeaQ/YmgE (transglycosylase-associated protein family)